MKYNLKFQTNQILLNKPSETDIKRLPTVLVFQFLNTNILLVFAYETLLLHRNEKDSLTSYKSHFELI